ncbi:hypothetical protein [Jeotgalibacillus marinus]|uniref:Uncharacterized protein n=1 Tax=Jeotgalibacillus marinus TaxID=86667 RepID=A0ABV3Q7S9_9BACL
MRMIYTLLVSSNALNVGELVSLRDLIEEFPHAHTFRANLMLFGEVLKEMELDWWDIANLGPNQPNYNAKVLDLLEVQYKTKTYFSEDTEISYHEYWKLVDDETVSINTPTSLVWHFYFDWDINGFI